MQCVVVYGDPFDGLVIVGPFEHADDASAWAESEIDDQTWWVVNLHVPERTNVDQDT